jgi:hypothetical protein
MPPIMAAEKKSARRDASCSVQFPNRIWWHLRSDKMQIFGVGMHSQIIGLELRPHPMVNRSSDNNSLMSTQTAL